MFRSSKLRYIQYVCIYTDHKMCVQYNYTYSDMGYMDRLGLSGKFVENMWK